MEDQITVRLEPGQSKKLKKLAKTNYNKPSGLIRMAIDQLILAAEQNGGSLPVPELKAAPEPESHSQAA